MSDDAPELWHTACEAASLLAACPAGLGGMVVKAPPGPVRDAFLAMLKEALPDGTPWLRMPHALPEARLTGGIDLASTLAAGKPVFERGLLASAHGGVLIAGMAERMDRAIAARLEAALDTGQIRIERDHVSDSVPAAFALILFDEGEPGEDAPPASLTDRLAFHVDLTGLSWRDLGETLSSKASATALPLQSVMLAEGHAETLVALADALGIASLRAPLLAAMAARAHAAQAGRVMTDETDIASAARLVLAPRATRLPAPPEEQQAPPPEEQEHQANDPAPETMEAQDRPLEDKILDAIASAIPADLLAQLQAGRGGRLAGRGAEAGRKAPATRGRPLGARRGDPRRERLDLLETLRAAAPWQRLREQRGDAAIAVRKEDLRVRRFRPKSRTTTIFVVDASGSSALHRLAEAKGAVELVLAECYVRRDEAALIAFRGQKADIILPPTRSLTRARALLKGLPGGGGTPLALGLDAARQLADTVRRKGDRPFLILLTDAQANVGRDGMGGRQKAEEDALASADALHRDGFESLLIDTSPRPQPKASMLAARMGARYLALPQADARRLAAAIVPAR
ncbi:magnesium chelatase subunit D [Rhizobiales bacterium TNE-4]|nr:magnesium chelatase subunit D [Rhizobiales bacterium TNE-4]MBV1826916.1 magnesium chelatase subunit D [Rhizobiales bacterium TNE-4]